MLLCLQKKAILTTIGVLEEPLGNARLHGARLMAALLHTNTPSINQELCRLNTMGLLLVSGHGGGQTAGPGSIGHAAAGPRSARGGSGQSWNRHSLQRTVSWTQSGVGHTWVTGMCLRGLEGWDPMAVSSPHSTLS